MYKMYAAIKCPTTLILFKKPLMMHITKICWLFYYGKMWNTVIINNEYWLGVRILSMHYSAYMNCALHEIQAILGWICEHWLLSRAFVLLLLVQWSLFSDSLNAMFSDPCWVYSKKLTVLHVNGSIWPRASQPLDPTSIHKLHSFNSDWSSFKMGGDMVRLKKN